MQAPALTLAAVTKEFDARRVLGPLALTVAPAETVAVLGPNGSGKSTLLRIASALARPTSGAVHVCGLDAHAQREPALACLGVVTQDAPVDGALTPAEHVAWWQQVRRAAAKGMAASAAMAAPADTLAAWGLLGQADLPARALSRGQRQRLALCLALAHDPPVAVLDEPYTGLDAQGTTLLDAALAARRGRRATLMALHDATQARTLADRVLRLERGALADIGPMPHPFLPSTGAAR